MASGTQLWMWTNSFFAVFAEIVSFFFTSDTDNWEEELF
jgi:hypothetical protein